MRKLFRNFIVMAAAIATVTACDKNGDDPEKVTVKVTAGETTLTTSQDITASVKVNLSAAPEKALNVTLSVDNDKIKAYNTKNSTNYQALPSAAASALTGLTGKVDAGKTTTTLTVALPAEQKASLTDENGYIIPLVAKASGYTATADTYYIVVKVEAQQGGGQGGSNETFNALKFTGNREFAAWVDLGTPVSLPNGWTVMFNIYLDGNQSQGRRIGNFGSDVDTWCNMLRFGQKSTANELEWFVGNGNRKNLYSGELTAYEWHNIALVYDNANKKVIMYVDGAATQTESVTWTGADIMTQFKAIEFGNSWGNAYRTNDTQFIGRLSHYAVFNKALTDEEIDAVKFGNYDASASAKSALAAEWPMNEGEGSVLKESTGKSVNIDFSKMTRCDNESTYVATDISAYVEWSENNTWVEE